MPFLPQPSQFILGWDRHLICLLAYPTAYQKFLSRTGSKKLRNIHYLGAHNAYMCADETLVMISSTDVWHCSVKSQASCCRQCGYVESRLCVYLSFVLSTWRRLMQCNRHPHNYCLIGLHVQSCSRVGWVPWNGIFGDNWSSFLLLKQQCQSTKVNCQGW